MSSSVGGASALNLALLNQLLQRAGALDNNDTGTTSETSDISQTGADGTSFTTQADALFNALDSDGDGKLSKSELQTGFQKLSQGMQAVLLQQQGTDDATATGAPPAPAPVDGSAAASTFSSLDTDGDGVVSESEFEAGLSADSTASSGTKGGATTADVTQLLESLMHSLRDSSSSALFKSLDTNGDGSLSDGEFTASVADLSSTSGASSSSSSGSSSSTSTGSTGSTSSSTGSSNLFSALDGNSDSSISSEEWEKLLQDMQNSAPGDLANQPAMMGLQQSTNLNSSLMYLLQSTDLKAVSAPLQ